MRPNLKVLILASTLSLVVISCRKEPQTNVVAVDTGDAASAEQRIREADLLYAQREDVSKVRLAIASLRQARVADYGSYEAAWKLAKSNYFLGAHTSDKTEKEHAFREGIEHGRIAVQLQKDRPEGHFWLGANYGGDAQVSTLSGLANIQDIRSEMETVLRLDEKFEGGSAYLVMGQSYLGAPRVLGGSTKKAIEYFEKGVTIDANNAMLRLYLAKGYRAAKRNKDALAQIDYLRKMTPYPDYVPEYKDALREAQELQEEIEKKRQVN